MGRRIVWAQSSIPAGVISINAPVVSDQSIEFGRLTLVGAGKTSITSTSGTITSITLGTRTVGSNHFTTSGAYILPSAVPSDAQYVWTGCTATGVGGTSNTFTLTINTEANTYSFATDADLTAIFAISVATTSGKTFRGRAGSYASFTIDTKAFTSETFLTGHSGVRPLFLLSTAASIFNALRVRNSTNVTLKNLDIQKTGYTGNVAAALGIDGSSDTKVDSCEVYGIIYDHSTDFSISGYPGNCRGVVCDVVTNISFIGTTYIHDVLECLIINSIAGNCTVQGTDANNPLRMSYMPSDGIRISRTSTFGVDTFQDIVCSYCLTSSVSDGFHVDSIQFNGVGLTADWTGVTCTRIRMFEGGTGKTTGIFANTASPFHMAATATDCIYAGSFVDGINFTSAINTTVDHCTVVSYDPNDGTIGPARITVGASLDGGGNTITNSVAEQFSGVARTNCATLGENGSIIPYTTAFVGPTFAPTTVAELLAKFKPNPAGPLDVSPYIGAIAP